MAIPSTSHPAHGGPGIEPRWTRSDKDGVGTAYSALSRVWFTVSKGILNEVYYPTIDRPQIRDLQYLVTDGATFFLDERHLDNTLECIEPGALGFRIVNADPQGRFRIVKEVIADPHQACVLVHTRLEADTAMLARLRLFALLAPHLEVGGRANNGNVVDAGWGRVLTAHKGGTWLALAASIPFARCSCGYVGATDGWRDLAHDFRMDWEFDCAPDGNIALTGELDLRRSPEFVLALAFGDTLHHALVTTAQALGKSFVQHRARFVEQWQHACAHVRPGSERAASDGGRLFRASHSILLAHEDKTYDGALIASLSIPWGESRSGDEVGGYHLVWTRDMCHSATGLLAAGSAEAPLRALIYLACTQNEDGGYSQNFWINGEPHWGGVQLDQTAFPLLLARQLHHAGALQDFDPAPMILRAAGYLIERGPVTPQERWEENSGLSPSTLAAHIAGLVCAAAFVRERGDDATARYLEDYADFLESHIEPWTVTTEGSLVPDIRRHFIRMHPAAADDPRPDEDANHGLLHLANQPPGARSAFPAKDVVDAGFLELVRYGVRAPGDPLIEDSLRVVDAVLGVDTPRGPGWRRYNHDGYGQREDGGPYRGWGYGHAWPLLTGERGHYELAAGRDVGVHIRAMERFASSTRLLPEQVWALPDLPAAHMFRGRPTGGAMPLCWAHAEYIKLVRSATDGRVFDLIPEVADRYRGRVPRAPLEVWKFNRQVRSVPAGGVLRVQAGAPFRLRWTCDEWEHTSDTPGTPIATGHAYVDIKAPRGRAPIRFTFFWTEADRWEGRDFEVGVG
ncbi:MAG TPA: glycoside hydrolase family 15 protein [Phycisphaerales bacterium]|nr:glycoside hydrolase family 15 protein [Phycisphaerales bacterium]